MDALLTKMHGAMAVQTQLANTGAILSLYQRHLTQQLREGCSADLLLELQQVSSLLPKLMREQAEAAGKAMSGLWGVRRHLWLSQSMLQPEDRTCLLRLPVVPSAMFGPEAAKMLQQAQEARRCAREVSGAFRQSQDWRRPKPQQPKPQQPTWSQGDLRAQLDASRRSRAKRGRRGRGAQGPPQSSPQP